MDLDFMEMFDGIFHSKKILITGHTGFKGSWLSLWLHLMGAQITGYALPPSTFRDNYVLCGLKDTINDITGDIREKEALEKVFHSVQPDIVFHLAAQPLVRESYLNPYETFETNVMGTLNVLEQVRNSPVCNTAVIITSDKCYENNEHIWGYRENDRMGGHDPYSASKGCTELLISSYIKSFFHEGSGKAIASVRAGNVIGGGDWSCDRIIPDCIRALEKNLPITLRNPQAVRPWQHVLDPLYGYLLLASKMLSDGSKYNGGWNFGPDFQSIVPVQTVADLVLDFWGSGSATASSARENMHEASFLSLDCTKAKTYLEWQPWLSLPKAVEYTVSWYQNYKTTDISKLCRNQILEFYRNLKGTVGP